jgi:multiple antibiotic resistance protein
MSMGLRGLILFLSQSIEVCMPLSYISIPDVLIFFFLTLGPLKAIAPFAGLTQECDPTFRRAVAWRATTVATIIVLAVALLGDLVLENWHVSIAAIVITGSIILFSQAFQMIMQPLAAAPAPTPPCAVQSPPSLEIAHFPLAIPVLVTAPGLVAIVGFMAIAAGHWAQKGIVLAGLLVIMGLNLITLLNIEAILKHGSPLVQRVLGWVMAVLQAALAVQYLINGLVRLGVFPTLVS